MSLQNGLVQASIPAIVFLLTLCFLTCDDALAALRLENPEDCFKLLDGVIGDCDCELKVVTEFNNQRLFPKLEALVQRNYFRYVKVNLKADCPFWRSDWLCATQDCHVTGCGSNEMPPGIQESEMPTCPGAVVKPTQQHESDDLGGLDETLSPTSRAAFEKWTDHDDSLLQFCEWDDDTSNASQYVDLLRNPERFTGYAGKAAHKIWNSIYQENCFNDLRGSANPMRAVAQQQQQCLEIRVYHRLISGLHTSINTHLSHKYLLQTARSQLLGQQQWGPNVTEFLRRFHPQVESQGPTRLRNLHFIFLLELRAVAKAAPLLRREKFFTGNRSDDQQLKQQIAELLDTVASFPGHFDESVLFRGQDKEQLKYEIREKFFNITRIMDCVGCDKCRLWGKVQTTGLGTALRLLFSPKLPRYLRRHEIVTLFNSIARLSESIRSLQEFRSLMRNMHLRNEL